MVLFCFVFALFWPNAKEHWTAQAKYLDRCSGDVLALKKTQKRIMTMLRRPALARLRQKHHRFKARPHWFVEEPHAVKTSKSFPGTHIHILPLPSLPLPLSLSPPSFLSLLFTTVLLLMCIMRFNNITKVQSTVHDQMTGCLSHSILDKTSGKGDFTFLKAH